MLEKYNAIFTHLKIGEKKLLLRLAQELSDCPIIVEIGSYLGASTCFLAHGVIDRGGVVYAVDSWTNIAMTEGSKDTFNEFKENVSLLSDTIIPLRGLSADIAKDFVKNIDFLFIDGDHSYEGVYADLEGWLPKLKDGAIIAFHDYSWANGVQRAVRELIFPIQIEAARKVDSIYWTRVSPSRIRANTPFATVVIPTYKRNQYVIDCLNSVLNQDTSVSYEVMVLDNACDSSIERVVESINASVDISVYYIPVDEIGLHNGRNIAAMEGKGQIIVYIDDDVIVPKSWLEEICKPFNDPYVAGVGGKTIPQWEVSPVPEWLKCLPSSYFSLLDLGEEDSEMQWPQTPYGCNMAYRRSLIIEYDGFPPDSVGGGWLEWNRGDGETGFAKKIYADHDRHKILYSCSAWLYHRIPINRTTLSSARHRAMKGSISSFYSEYRSNRYGRKELIERGLSNIYRASQKYIWNLPKRIMHPIEKWINQELQVSTEFSLGLYQLRLAFDYRLRSWVIKDSYWPKKYTDIN